MAVHNSDTTLRQPWLKIARAAWIVWVVILLLLTLLSTNTWLNITLYSCAGQPACPVPLSLEDVQLAQGMGVPGQAMVWLTILSSLIARFSLAAMGVIIFWKRSDDWLALLMSAALFSSLVEGTALPQDLSNAFQALVGLVYIIGTVMYLPLPFIFPNGRFVPRWSRLPVLLVCLAASIGILTIASLPWLMPLSMLLWTILTIYAVPYRYRRESSPTERQQVKWVGIGFIFAIVSGLIWSTGNYFYPITDPSQGRVVVLLLNIIIYPLGYAGLAACIGIAILRYRLWDVDLLIRRTLVYGLLTGSLALVFFGGVTLLQSLFTAFSEQSSTISVVISTLAIAALFNPLRRRIQNDIDRRFYRRKYNAEQALARFAALARSETDIEKLSQELQVVIIETMQPERVALWLRPPESEAGSEPDLR